MFEIHDGNTKMEINARVVFFFFDRGRSKGRSILIGIVRTFENKHASEMRPWK
jgi:hypothetical protein